MGKGENGDPPLLLQAQQVHDYFVGLTNGAIDCIMCWTIISRYSQQTNKQWPMKGKKGTSRTYCKHSRHLSVCGYYPKRFSAKTSTFHLVNCSQEGMLEF